MPVELETFTDQLHAVRRVLDGADEALLGVAFVQQRGVNLIEPQLSSVGEGRLSARSRSARMRLVAEHTGPGVPNVFISYRRRDTTAGYASWIYERLAAEFGSEHIFMDIDSLPPGVDFVDSLQDKLSATDVALVLIGPQWLNASDARGRRRLDDPEDFVRIEVATALREAQSVIPVLVDGAEMPTSAALPPDLRPLSRRQAFTFHRTGGAAITALLASIERAQSTGTRTGVGSSQKSPAKRDASATHALQELVAAEVREIFATDKRDDFRIIESRAQPGDFIQWLGGPGEGFHVEISDPERNETPPRPLTGEQLAAVDRLGFRKDSDANFVRIFEFSDGALPQISRVITAALTEIFGLTDVDQVDVFTG